MATYAGVGAFALAGLWALHLGPPSGSAREPAPRIPVELSLEETAAPSRPSALPPARPSRAPAPRPPAVRYTPRPSDTRSARGPSAQAATVVAREPSRPIDSTSETLVIGAAKTYGGGATQTQGTSTAPVEGNELGSGTFPRPASGGGAGSPDQSAPVRLASQSWSCPWPSEADPLPIDEETVVIRVVVRPDGSAESVAVVSDPGHGFGEAAASCALRTRFTPARATGGNPTRAPSPPIRVRFTR